LTYDFCLKLFGQVEAIKRDKFSPETMRQWFIEFIRKGWTKKILQNRYDALIDTKIYGIEKIDIADWVNAVPVFSQEEVGLMINKKIDTLIARGSFLKDKEIELTEEDKQAIELAEAKAAEFRFNSGYYEKRQTYQEERRKLWDEKFK
jgi:hypothetical protein